jgi:hypothetical protein
MGQYIMCTNNQHAKNEQLWANKGLNIVAKIVTSYSEVNEKNASSFNLWPSFGF